MSDAWGAAELLGNLPPYKVLLADKSYDADWFLEPLQTRGLCPASPPGAGEGNPPVSGGSSTSNVTLSRTFFAHFKDWRCIAATVMCWL